GGGGGGGGGFPYDSLSKNKKITLAHLLSQSAGLTVHGFPGYDLEANKPTLPQVLDGTPPANTPPVRSQFEPGLKFQYSGGGTTISQLILTDVTKQPYDVFMYENVLKPMGMVNSSYSQPPAKNKLALCASAYHKDGTAVPHKFHVYPEQAAAGLWMTPSDLCNYIIETQLAYEGKSSKVLNQEMTKLRLTPYNDASAGLGVFIEDHNKSLYFQHSAGNEGFCGQYFGSLEGGNGVVVFLNTDDFAIIPEVINSVASVYKWKDFYNPVSKKAVNVPEAVVKTYEGVYFYDDKWAVILKKDDNYCFYTDGVYAKMYFSSPTDFFNKEFPSEKKMQMDKEGNVTGYLRKVNNTDYPAAKKITKLDTLTLSKYMFNDIAWLFLLNKNYKQAVSYLDRSLQLYPGELFTLGNLAHCFLFNNNYIAAIEIYKAHLNEKVEGNFTWKDMINQDFMFFKNNGFDKAPMERVFAELSLKAPEGF
ncbi:MAG TPA: serine hydrolase, partial [Saprospiraceae bacterium]|nr:serine hydrolase [Saprospiraceae bacterium]